MKRTLSTAGLALALLLGAAACSSSSGSDDAAKATATTSTSIATTTSEATTTTEAISTTTAPATTTTAAGPATALPPCQDLLQEYTDAFTPDDLTPVIAFFHRYSPVMPTDVGAAVERIAAAYEAADGDMSKLNFDDVDLTADSKTFSDWTAQGCPGP